MSLRVREVFATVQGEGSQAGTPAVFVRFSGCNLWSGLEGQRHMGAGDCAMWCDTDFAHGSAVEVRDLVRDVVDQAAGWREPLCVLTGGEPILQLRKPEGLDFLERLHDAGIRTAVETNGTQAITGELTKRIGHVTVSPKGLVGAGSDDAHLVQRWGTDLKVVVPTPIDLDRLADSSRWRFVHYFVQPKDVGDGGRSSLDEAVRVARRYGWRISLQSHKLVGWR